MKTSIKIFILAAVLFFGSSTAMAQQKLGYINSGDILQALPETAEAQKALETYTQELQDQYEALEKEFASKASNLQKNIATYSEAIRAQYEKELNDLRVRIQEFGQVAEQDLGNKRQEVMQPVIKKVQDAITAVGTENGFSYIFDLSAGGILYFNETTGNNIMPLVKAKLGIK